MDEFARITHRVARFERWELRLISRELDLLLVEGFFCELCRWKLCLFASAWFADALPLVAWRFRSQVPGRSQLLAGGRDLEAEIEEALSHYPWPA